MTKQKIVLIASVAALEVATASARTISCENINGYVKSAPNGFDDLVGEPVVRYDLNPNAKAYTLKKSPYSDAPAPERCNVIRVPGSRPNLRCELTGDPVSNSVSYKLKNQIFECLGLGLDKQKKLYWIPGEKIFYAYPNGTYLSFSHARYSDNVPPPALVPELEIGYGERK